MRENRPYGSEGGEEASASFSTPIGFVILEISAGLFECSFFG